MLGLTFQINLIILSRKFDLCSFLVRTRQSVVFHQLLTLKPFDEHWRIVMIVVGYEAIMMNIPDRNQASSTC